MVALGLDWLYEQHINWVMIDFLLLAKYLGKYFKVKYFLPLKQSIKLPEEEQVLEEVSWNTS